MNTTSPRIRVDRTTLRPTRNELREGDYKITYDADEPDEGLWQLDLAIKNGIMPLDIARELGRDVISIAKNQGYADCLRLPDWLRPSMGERVKSVLRRFIY